MRKVSKSVLLLLLAVLLAGTSAQGISKVARSLNVVDFYGGYATPWGNYNGLVGEDFIIGNHQFEVKSDDLYESGFYIGFNYGTIRRGHLMYQVGFRYTNHNFVDSLVLVDTNEVEEVITTVTYYFKDINYRQYDFDFNFNYLFNDLNVKAWSPYLGVGVQAGFTSKSIKGYDSESEIEMALNLNYGLDVKIWKQAQNRGFLAVSSSNSVNLLVTDDRPKYFNFGLSLKYYFRP